MKTIILKGEPKSTNHIYKSHCRFGYPKIYMCKSGKILKEDYSWQAKSQWHNDCLTCDVEVEIKLFFGTKRKQDIDNFSKLLFDALTGIVWNDDSQIKKNTTELFCDKDFPRIELSIKKYK